jgi:hypothetical protein
MAELDDLQKVMLRIEQLLKNSSQTTGGRPSVAGGRSRDQADKNDNRTFRARSAGLESLSSAAGGAAQSLNSLSKTVQNTRANFVAMNRSMRGSARVMPGVDAGGTKVPDAASLLPRAAALGGAAGADSAQSMLGNIFGRAGGPNGPVQKSVEELGTSISKARVGLLVTLSALGTAIKAIVNQSFMLRSSGIDPKAMGELNKNAISAGMSLEEYTKVLQENAPAVSRSASFEDFNKQLTGTTDQLAGFGLYGETATKLAATMDTSAATLGVGRDQISSAVSDQIKVFKDLGRSTLMTADTMAELTRDVANNAAAQDQLLGMDKSLRPARIAELTAIQGLGLSMGMTKQASKELGDALISQRNLTTVQRFGGSGALSQVAATLGMDAGDAAELSNLHGTVNKTTEEMTRYTELLGEMQKRQETLKNSANVSDRFRADNNAETLNTYGIGNLAKLSGVAAAAVDAGPVKDVNKQYSTGATDAEQFLGKAAATAEGASKNSIVGAITTALGAAAFTTGVGSAIGNVVSSTIMRFVTTGAAVAGTGAAVAGAGAVATGAVGAGGVAAAGLGLEGAALATTGVGAATGLATLGKALGPVTSVLGTFGKMLGPLGIALTTVLPLVDAYSNYKSADADNKDNVAAADKQRGESVGEGIGTVVGAALGLGISGLVGFLTGGIGLFATGIITSITTGIGTWLGKMLGGWWNTSKTIADQTVETKKNTEELKKTNDVKEEQATQILSGTENLVSSVINQGKHLADQTGVATPQLAKVVKSSDTVAKAVDENNDVTYDAMGNVTGFAAQVAKSSNAVAKAVDANNTATYDAMGNVTGFAATAGAEAAAAIATPGPTVRTSVTPPVVNTPTDTATTATTTAPIVGATAMMSTPDLTTTLATIISLLQQSVDAENMQVQFAEAMSRAAGRPTFSDNNDNFARAISI